MTEREIRRVAMISLHTSPLDQPGTGDAGGMNVYVTETARELARRGVEVDIYTRATSSTQPPVVAPFDGIAVHHIVAGPFEGLTKGELPSQMCVFAREVLRAEASHEAGHYDLVHSHYWLSGQVGALCRDRWGVPLVHTMHTMAKVKNAFLADGDTPEPAARIIGEQQVVSAADMLIANTDDEAKDLIRWYSADAERVEVVNPGVDLQRFAPRAQSDARERLGIPADADLLLFVGRIQPLKAPDIVLRAAAELVAHEPSRRHRLVVAIVGGPSGTGLQQPEALSDLAASLGISDLVRFVPPVSRDRLVDWYAAASVVCVPSHSESFGLVAVEAQAVGTPVVAAAVGGLSTAVADGLSGVLVHGHDPRDYADALARVLDDASFNAHLRSNARAQAERFSWQRTAVETLGVYSRAQSMLRSPQ